MLRAVVLSALCVAPLTLAVSAAAQTPTTAADTAKDKPLERAAEIPAEIKPDFVQEAQGTAGGQFNSGNVEGASGRVNAFYGFRYLNHGLRADGGFGVAALALDATEVDADNKEDRKLGSLFDNINTTAFAKLRYDYFLGDIGSIYASGMAQHDSPSNLLGRLRADLGYRHFFFNSQKHALSGELGGVYTIDNAAFDGDTTGDGRVSVWEDATRFEEFGVIAGRIAITYKNALLENVTYTQTLEIIPNITDVEAPFEAARLNGGDNKLGLGEATMATSISQLMVNLNSSLSIGMNLTLAYDNGAIARRNAYTNHDIILSAQLGYKIF